MASPDIGSRCSAGGQKTSPDVGKPVFLWNCCTRGKYLAGTIEYVSRWRRSYKHDGCERAARGSARRLIFPYWITSSRIRLTRTGTKRADTSSLATVRTEIAFLCRVRQLLKVGGHACVIQPDGVLENPSYDSVSQRILSRCAIIASQRWRIRHLGCQCGIALSCLWAGIILRQVNGQIDQVGLGPRLPLRRLRHDMTGDLIS